MQVDLTVVVSLAAGIVSTAVGIIVFLGKLNAKQHVDSLDDRFENLEKKHNDLGARLGGRLDATEAQMRDLLERAHREELARVKAEGELALVKQSSEEHHRDLELIQEKMVTRVEWEARLKSLEDLMKQTLIEVRAVARSGPTRYSSSQTPAPTVMPPRPDRR